MKSQLKPSFAIVTGGYFQAMYLSDILEIMYRVFPGHRFQGQMGYVKSCTFGAT